MANETTGRRAPYLGDLSARVAEAIAEDPDGIRAALGDLGYVTASVVTGDTTLDVGDAGTVVEVDSASAVNVTVPTHAASALPVGSLVAVMQYGAGPVAVSPASGVAVRSPSGLTTRTRYSTVNLRKRGSAEWVLSGDVGPATGVATVEYAASTAIIANPERGLFQYSETHYQSDGSGYTALSANSLAASRSSDGRSLVYRYFVMEKYLTVDTLDSAWLDLVTADLTAVRAAGCKIIPRFVYSTSGDIDAPPYSADPPVARVLGHITQLSPILKANADVIDSIEAGFIGMWGEWYYSDNFGDLGTINATDYHNRWRVLSALLDATDPSTYVLVRYPGLKERWA